jgi:hypothetical protein
MKRRQKHAKALKVWCIVLAILLLVVSGTWYLAYRNGWWFYNDEYLARKMSDLAHNYFADYRERLIAEGGADSATEALRRIESSNGMVVSLGDIFIGKNADKTDLKTRFIDKSGCDKKNTLANIVPREPFGATDVEISVKLSCQE